MSKNKIIFRQNVDFFKKVRIIKCEFKGFWNIKETKKEVETKLVEKRKLFEKNYM